MTLQNLILIHAAATLSMVGLIWFVQLVHYPLFHTVGTGTFTLYEQEHQQRTSWVVVPLMLTEAAATAALLFTDLSSSDRIGAWIGAALLVVIWTSTAFVQVPLHRSLAAAFDPLRARQLVDSNWIRTVAWSARGLIAVLLLKS